MKSISTYNFSALNFSTPLFYFFVLVTILGCTPIIKGVIGYSLLLILVLPVILNKLNSRAYRTNSLLIVSTLLSVFVIILYRLIGISTAAPGYYLGLLLFYMIVLLLPLVPTDGNQKLARKLWWCVMLIMLFNVADNIRLSILYPEINIRRFYLDSGFLSSINAGGGSFYTFSLFFFCVCFFLWLNVEQKKVKWFSLIAAVIVAVYICCYCFKASVVLFFLLSASLIYYAKKTKDTFLFLTIAGISGVITVVLIGVYSDVIIDYIIDVSPNPRLTARFVTLIDDNAEEAQENTVTGRTTLYMLSIKTWLTNILTFFMGIGDHFTVTNAAKTGIGQHADLPDTLARYGVLGISLVFLMLRSCIIYILSLFDKKYKLQVMTILMIYVLCGCVKGIFETEIGCVLFILLPLSSIFLKSNLTYNK